MSNSGEAWIKRIMSKEDRTPVAFLMRAVLRAGEPGYAQLMRLRNRFYDAGVFKSHRLPAQVISVGNITAGGTGKTPVVRWLAHRLLRAGLRPGILLRGHKRRLGEASDEELLLREALPDVPVIAQPDRVLGGQRLLAEHPDVDTIILDDGFQHRRLARSFDLVLIDATNPFGFDHVHPRGLLREPLIGLRRADAFVLTRSDQVCAERRSQVEAILRGWNHRAPVYRARHAIAGFETADGIVPLEALAAKRFFLAAGIGNPQSLERQARAFPGEFAGHRWYGDHHHFTRADLVTLLAQASAARANILLVTGKDWVKLRQYAQEPAIQDGAIPIWRIRLDIEFEANDTGLVELIRARLEKAKMTQSVAG